jgi:cell division protease FtsH
VRRFPRALLIYVALGLLVLFVGMQWLRQGEKTEKLNLTEFRAAIDDGDIESAEVKDRDNEIVGEKTDGTKYKVTYPAEFADELATELNEADPAIDVEVDAQHESFWGSLLFSLLPMVLLIGFFLFFLNSMQGGGGRVMQFGKAKARQVQKDEPKVTFADVAGCDEAVEELQEIKEFLQNPLRFQAIGARIPKGVLLYGPPGTGKTLLARAVAGEAGVPFFSISGSDFVEMFVGVGASRVRDLFDQAKQAAPAIIFVDEIDAVGRHRGAGLGGGHDEREQTLNQLLVEMDGFDARTGVILVAATNRPDILDPALLRPGRFDRQIVVDQPDLTGRKAILEVHAKGKPLADGVNLETLAKRTPGFTGADLANLMNEAALLSARFGLDQIGMMQLDEAIDRVLAGPERRSRVMSDHDKRVVAYHEAGHALVGHVLPGADDVHKVSIVARGRALGLTWYLPEDRYTHTAAQLMAKMAAALGGRSAEELVFGEITTGAADDIEHATRISQAMVTQYGMSNVLGLRRYGQEQAEVFLGRELGHQRDYSDDIAAQIDAEINGLLDDAHAEARAVLETHRATLDALAQRLIEKETIEDTELAEIFGGLDAWTGAGATESPREPEAAPVAPEPVGSAAAIPVEPEPVAKRRWSWRPRPARPSST